MITITAAEFKDNFDKYIELGKLEEIVVTDKESVIFTIVPKKEKDKKDLIALFGSLPREAYSENPERE